MPKKTGKPTKAKNKEELPQATTNATLDEHKQEVLDKGRVFVRPLSLTRRRVVIISVGLAVALLVASLSLLGLFIYRYKSDSEFVYQASRIIPYPAGRVNGKFITYADFLFELRPLKHYYESPAGPTTANREPVNFSTPEGQKQLEELRRIALDEARKKIVIEQLAKEKGVKVSRQELNDAVNEAVQREGGEKKFAEAIDYFYGWTIDDFRRVLNTQLVQRKLQPLVSENERKQAEDVLNRAKAGEDFAALAKQFSNDPGSKDKGGELDPAPRGTYVKEFEDAAFSLEAGQISNIVETQFGFHIMKLIEKNDDQVKVAHILIQYKDLGALINEKLQVGDFKNYLNINLTEEPVQQS